MESPESLSNLHVLQMYMNLCIYDVIPKNFQ